VEVRSPADVVLGGSVIDIADARTMDGETVTVEGVVTWGVPFPMPTRDAFLQDGTGGISVFDFDLEAKAGAPLQQGDRVRIRGVVGAFRGEVQLSPVTTVVVLGSEAVPAAREVTAAEINAGMFQGELVMVTGATVVDVTVLSFGNQRVELTDGSAGTFFVFADSRTGVLDTAWNVGEVYTVLGVLGTDDRDTPAPRLEVRQPSDVNQTS
jgi:predicted extracellular nuclease